MLFPIVLHVHYVLYLSTICIPRTPFFFFFQGDGQVQSFIVAKSGLLASYSWGGGEEPCRMAWLWHAFQPSPEHINRKNRTRVNAGYTANPVEQVRSEDTLVGMTTNTLSCTDGGQ